MLHKHDLEIIKNKSLFTYKDAIVNILTNSVCIYYSWYYNKKNVLKDYDKEIISDDFLWHYSEDFYKNKIRYVRKYLSNADPREISETVTAPFLDGHPLIYSKHAYCYTTTSWELFEEKYRKEAIYVALKEMLYPLLYKDRICLAMFTAYLSKTPFQQSSNKNALKDADSIYFGVRCIEYKLPSEWIEDMKHSSEYLLLHWKEIIKK